MTSMPPEGREATIALPPLLVPGSDTAPTSQGGVARPDDSTGSETEWTLAAAEVPELAALVDRVQQTVTAQLIQASAVIAEPGRFTLGSDADSEVVALHAAMARIGPAALSQLKVTPFLDSDRRGPLLGHFAGLDFTRPLGAQIAVIQQANPLTVSAQTLQKFASVSLPPGLLDESPAQAGDDAEDGATPSATTPAVVPYSGNVAGASTTGSYVEYCVDKLVAVEISGPYHHDADHMAVIGSSVNTGLIKAGSVASSVAAATETISLDCGWFNNGDVWSHGSTPVASWVWPDDATFPMIIHTVLTLVHLQSDDANALAIEITEAVKSKVAEQLATAAGTIAGSVLAGPVGAAIGAAVGWAIGQVLSAIASWLESWFGGSGDHIYPAAPVHTVALSPLTLFQHSYGERTCEWPNDDNGADYQLSRHYLVNPKYPNQSNWRWCNKCQALSYGGATGGVCPADHKPHNVGPTASSNYFLTYSMPDPYYGLEANWRWCSKCDSLWWAAYELGPCPAGGTHLNASWSYSVITGSPSISGQAQTNWKLCHKCWVLAYGGNGPGSCAAGGGHQYGTTNHWMFYV